MSRRRVAAAMLAASWAGLVATGCGFKGPLTLPESSEAVITRAPAQAAGATTTAPAEGAPATTTIKPKEERPPPPPLPGTT